MLAEKVRAASGITVLFLLLTSALTSQTIDFDLSDYEKPDLKRHSLDTEFDLSGRHQFSDGLMSNSTSSYDTDNFTNTFYFNGSGTYSYLRYTNKVQRNLSAVLTLNDWFNGNNREQENSPLERTYLDDVYDYGFDSELRLSAGNRYYPVNSDLFFETNLFFRPEFSFEKSETTEEDDYDYTTTIDGLNGYDYYEGLNYTKEIEYEEDKETSSGISFDPEILAGYGRIDDVSDARIAVYIYQDLKDKNCLERHPSKEDIVTLSKLITTLKNERFFDAREKKIEDITRIDSFLKDNGFVKDNGPAYFTSIYDNWEYPAKQRLSGCRISAGFVPEFSYSVSSSKNNYENSDYHDRFSSYYTGGVEFEPEEYHYSSKAVYEEEVDATYSGYGLFGIVKFEHEKPLSLNLQGSFSSRIMYGRDVSDAEYDYKEMSRYDVTDILITETTVDSTLTHSESDTTYTVESNSESKMLDVSVSCALRYYPSTRTDMGVRLNAVYNYWDTDYEYYSEEYNDISQALSISLMADTNYYFSPQLRLSGNVLMSYNAQDIEYDDDNERESDNFSIGYGLTLNYYIF